jgi:hypothetical protein
VGLCAVVHEPAALDDQSMSIIDRSPGGFIVVANAILYGTVLAETGMLISGNVLLMGAVLALIAVLAVGICAFIMQLVGSEAYTLGEADEPAVARPARSAGQRRQEARPAIAPHPMLR